MTDNEKEKLRAVAKLLEIYAFSEKMGVEMPVDKSGEAEKVYSEMDEFLRELADAN